MSGNDLSIFVIAVGGHNTIAGGVSVSRAPHDLRWSHPKLSSPEITILVEKIVVSSLMSELEFRITVLQTE